jgi:hypothetical protein
MRPVAEPDNATPEVVARVGAVRAVRRGKTGCIQ